MLKQSPWSSTIEKGIDSLADWLIPTLGRPDDFTFTLYWRLCVFLSVTETILLLKSQVPEFCMIQYTSGEGAPTGIKTSASRCKKKEESNKEK